MIATYDMKAQPKSSRMFRRIALAAVTAVFFYYIFVFINLGTIWVMNSSILRELMLMFLFLLLTFWLHEKISRYFSTNPFPKLPPYGKTFLEAAIVIVVSLFLCLFIIYLPTYIVIPGVNILPLRVRLGCTVSTIISLFFYYFVERQRERKQLQTEFLRAEQLQKENFKAQLEALKNQVNPHFLFNSLNILSSLIYVDQDRAAQFLGQLADVYRALLDSGGKELVPLQKELELANTYSSLLKTRFGDSVHFQVDVKPKMLHYQLPPTSVQMLLENAIKHNGSTSQKPLIISIRVVDQKLVVTNNLQPRLDEVSSTKVGLQNISNRYKYLTDQQVEVEQTDSEFIVRLPLLQVEEV
ncbi:sensor histidine kinase [Pontibacter chitinilyticus]|uniref:sensor histidine kinase n=1 Tax=Pontibacter chitinilyticus TaxID=2674989 RepID=UPI003219E4D0